MGKSYSSDLRERISAHVLAGYSRREAARRFGVSPSCAIKLVQRVSKTGSAAPAPQGRPPGGGKLAAYLTTLIRWVDEQPDITMPELASALHDATGVRAHPNAIGKFLRKLGYTHKKSRWLLPSVAAPR